MVTALYRRYRPETFAELIGQSQVTDPLRTALRNDRVNHAYLFSGPRGCGKTTSARILARCLNCVEGPTDTPCGVCPSCIELSRDGGGSMDVVEIDAASHNGVDDARDLRERAVFAPARDRYKIFILDEAHMVTPQGFNALLKIVEEPPEHVKFIFATTEPEKVIGTIRSRTHHYPFRLVPPAQMLEYVQSLCASEKVDVEAGVLPLVVRAGGGSVRDTLSLLDQLIAGSEGSSVQYERAVALLGYTHGALLGEVVDALGARDASAAFAAIDRVIQTGQDPRRFVEDLLERLRDLIIVSATGEGAAAVLRGVQPDELDRMAQQASRFGTAELSRAADVANSALTEMTGATSPRLHLELMIARVLVPASDETNRGALARVERLERRIGMDSPDGRAAIASERIETAAPPAGPVASASERIETPAVQPTGLDAGAERSTRPAVPSAGLDTGAERPAQPAEPSASERIEASAPPVGPVYGFGAAAQTAEPVMEPPIVPSVVTFQQVKDSWPEILERVEKAKRTAWMVVYTATPLALRDGNILDLSFASQTDVDALKQRTTPGEGISDYLKQAVYDVLGFRPLLTARAETPRTEPARAEAPPAPHAARPPVADGPTTSQEPPEQTEPDIEPPAPSGATWETAVITDSEPETKPKPVPEKKRMPEPVIAPPEPAEPAAPKRPAPVAMADGKQRYGESVVREILGASFIEEQTVAPRVAPREQ
ncbi:DNA polymerase III subunit gamma and tau [Glaciihabitans sp. INWT7]|uniref:DNA polymerase III subunit gamma and tau n=1 Tax=Glaciihabitans sp. INWT7 TaxID=2596912 RepID=UPI0016288C87|nr:DNA polymerase III subunit gamma and tau [Glaciihabitans sp. INWT7]QNE45828.1 DNA polymerase III subunit gamma and tau [Glaciihabitans sp. INWT7]